VPQRQPAKGQAFLKVTVTIDGPLGDFMKRDSDSCPLTNNSYFLPAGSGLQVTIGAAAKSYQEMFGNDGFQKNLPRDRLYGATITITVLQHQADNTEQKDVYTFYQYRWVDVVDPKAAQERTETIPGVPPITIISRGGDSAAFFRTMVGLTREKNVDVFVPSGTTLVGINAQFKYPMPSTGSKAVWSFTPTAPSSNSDPTKDTVTIKANGIPVGTLFPFGQATAPTTIGLNLDLGMTAATIGEHPTAFEDELVRVIKALVTLPNGDVEYVYQKDPKPFAEPIVDPNMKIPVNFTIASNNFKKQFAAFLPGKTYKDSDLVQVQATFFRFMGCFLGGAVCWRC
jgi:hypothetical protein